MRWTIRTIVGLGALFILTCAALISYSVLFINPKARAEESAARRNADIFSRLNGQERRLAIYDAFVAEIDQHYFDQSFAGLNWPEMKRAWREKAATVKDDTSLYTDVFFQMVQLFPASHFAAIMPPAPEQSTPTRSKVGQSAPTNARPDFTERDYGMQLVQLRRKHGTAIVVGEMWPSSPAVDAGISPGWIVNSYTFHLDPGLNVDHAHFSANLIRLTASQSHIFETSGSVQLVPPEIADDKAKVQAAMAEKQIKVDYDVKFLTPPPPFYEKTLPDGALYVRFDHFDADCLGKVASALATAGKNGVILDLRFNNGGYLMPLLNALLPPVTPAYRTRNAQGVRTTYTNLWTNPYRGPLAVLTGPYSASASEVAAGILQNQRRATIVGRTTNGSVLAANFFPLPDGGQVEIPTSDVEMLDGRRLEGVGVTPDVEVYPTLEDIRANRDPALDAADRVLSQKNVN